jgi:methyl coenzyme M reductase subunit D
VGGLPPQSPTPHAYWRDMLGITAIAQSPLASLGGTNANVDVTGIQLTTAVGSVSITAIRNPTIQLTTNLLNTQLGDIQVDPDVIVTGEQLTTVIGPYSVQADATTTIVAGSEKELETSVGATTVTANGTAVLSGVNATTAVGQVDGVFTVLVSGNELNSDTGTIGPITGTANVSAATNLLTISDQAVDVSIDVTASITGLTTMTTAVASVTVDLNTPVDISGQQMSISVGNTGTIAWSNVDPGVSNVWVEVDIAA